MDGGEVNDTREATIALAAMSRMTEAARAELIEEIERRWCRECGTSNKPTRCQCWNDE